MFLMEEPRFRSPCFLFPNDDVVIKAKKRFLKRILMGLAPLQIQETVIIRYIFEGAAFCLS